MPDAIRFYVFKVVGILADENGGRIKRRGRKVEELKKRTGDGRKEGMEKRKEWKDRKSIKGGKTAAVGKKEEKRVISQKNGRGRTGREQVMPEDKKNREWKEAAGWKRGDRGNGNNGKEWEKG